jgi:hypothetical protein
LSFLAVAALVALPALAATLGHVWGAVRAGGAVNVPVLLALILFLAALLLPAPAFLIGRVCTPWMKGSG